MTEIIDSPKRQQSADLQRLLFWGAMAIAAAGAGVAIAAGEAAGRAGAVLLIAIAAGVLVFLVWLSRGSGRMVGLFPERGATQSAVAASERSEYAWLEALEEPALVADRLGSPVAANQAYLAMATAAGALGESERPPHLDRLFGADPLVSPAMFRLAKSAAARQARREALPPTQLGDSGVRRLEVTVAPLSGARVLWRLRDGMSGSGAPAVADSSLRSLFIDDAPLAFAGIDGDGVIGYVNAAFETLVGYDRDHLLGARLKDFVKDDIGRLLRRDRRAATPSSPVVTLHTAVADVRVSLSVVGSDEADGLIRLYFAPEPVLTEPAALRVDDVGGLHHFFALAPYGAAILDSADPATALILDANVALMEMAQGAAQPGAGFKDLFEASDGPVALATRLRQGASGPVELQIAVDPPIAAHVRVADAGNGKSFAYVVNVSEQRELQQRLAQAEKMREIGLLAGGVAHDFNNLLTVVMMNCDYLLRRHPVGDPDFQDLSEINLHALRAKELSEMLRAYARDRKSVV